MKQNQINITILILGLLLMLRWSLAGEPRDGVPNPEPAPRQVLESAKAAAAAQKAEADAHPIGQPPTPTIAVTNAPHAAPQPPALEKRDLEQKAVAIILRKVWAIQTGKAVLLVVDPRYLADLTNIYPAQMIEKLALEER